MAESPLRTDRSIVFAKWRQCAPYSFIIIIIIIHLLRIKAAHNTLQCIKRSSSNKREEIKTNTTIKETNVQNKRKT